MKKLIVICTLLGLVACSKVVLMAPSQTDAERAGKKFPGMTLSDLNEGKAQFEKNCQKCHSLKNPASRNEAQWNKIVPKMAKKAKIDEKTEEQIRRYLVVMGKQK